ncbi:MAG: GTP cyclohydrolase I FolE [Chloroflexi bacterium]|nr:GTP cyclohydrolase I FolE [Chloroflexota bacterium]
MLRRRPPLDRGRVAALSPGRRHQRTSVGRGRNAPPPRALRRDTSIGVGGDIVAIPYGSNEGELVVNGGAWPGASRSETERAGREVDRPVVLPSRARGIDHAYDAENHVRALLGEIGENPQREGLLDTPKRVRKSLAFLTQGYQQNPRAVLESALFEEAYDEMVVVKDIEFYSLCEHHLLPFFGTAHIAYIPNGRIVGLSKLPRLVEIFARRLQVQERLTTQIAETLQEVLQPVGVAVVLDAAHLCMMMRGIQKQNSTTVTSCLLGRFRDDEKTRAEFLTLVR